MYLNLGFLIIVGVLKNTPGLKADMLSGINGSVSCFFIVYLIPIFLHLKCNFQKSNQIMNSDVFSQIMNNSDVYSNNNESCIELALMN